MSYIFNDEEKSRVLAALQDSSGLSLSADGSSYNAVLMDATANAVPVYQVIYDIILENLNRLKA